MRLAHAYRQCRVAISGLFDRRNLLAWGVLLGSLSVVLLSWHNLNNNQQTAASAQFELLADEDSTIVKAFGVPTTMGFAKRQAFLFKDGALVWVDLSASTEQQAADVLKAIETKN